LLITNDFLILLALLSKRRFALHGEKFMKLKKGPIPLYYQLERALRKRVLSGRKNGVKDFPNERQLCEEYGVSRATVRQALMILERDRLLIREQGRGTFITEEDGRGDLFVAYGFMDDLFLFGSKTTLKLRSRKLVNADAQLIEDMGLDEHDRVYRFEGIRISHEPPCSGLFRAWLPREIGKKITLENFSSPFLIGAVEDAALQRVSRAHQTIYATVATAEHASAMGVDVCHPILVLKRIFFTAMDRVVQVSETHLPGEAYRPITILERVTQQNFSHLRKT
jgi:GntR family transcriptional regulator